MNVDRRQVVSGIVLGAYLGLASVLVAGCGGGHGGSGGAGTITTPPPTGAAWTVMVYSVAANNLESMQLVTLDALQAVGSTDDVNIVCEIQTKTVSFGTPADTNAKRFFLKKAGTLATSQDDSDGYPKSVDMTSGSELQSFVSWAKRTHPAQRYALILCDHGNQWIGFGQDEHAGQTKVSYARLVALLDGAKAGLGGGQFDLLGFDACLMAGIEIDDVAAQMAKVLVASEETEIVSVASKKGGGWNYQDFLQDLEATPSMDEKALATAIVNRTGDLWETPGRSFQNYTLSAVDLSKVGAIVSGFKQFVTNHGPSVQSELTVLGLARAFCEGYEQQPSPADGGFHADLKDFLTLFAAGIPDSAINTTLAALDTAIIRSRHGPRHPRSAGISIYFPLNGNEATFLNSGDAENADYHGTKFAIDTGWGAYLDSYIAALNAFRASAPFPAVTIQGNAFPSGSGFGVNFTESGANTTAVTERILIPLSANTAVSVSEIEIAIGATGAATALWDGNLLVLSDGQKSDFMDTIPLGVGTGSYVTNWALTLPGAPTIQVIVLLQVVNGGTAATIESAFLVDPKTGVLKQISLDTPKLIGTKIQQVNRVFDLTTGAPSLATSSVMFTITSVAPLSLRVGNATAPSGNYVLQVAGYDFGGRSLSDSVSFTK